MKSQMIAHYDSLNQSFNNFRADYSEEHSILTTNINRIQIQPPRQATQEQQQDRVANDNIAAAGAVFDE